MHCLVVVHQRFLDLCLPVPINLETLKPSLAFDVRPDALLAVHWLSLYEHSRIQVNFLQRILLAIKYDSSSKCLETKKMINT